MIRSSRTTYQTLKEATSDQRDVELVAFRPEDSAVLLLGRVDHWCFAKLACLSETFFNAPPADPDDQWILIKRAGLQVKDVTAPFHYAAEPFQKLLGGPNSLTRTLAGGALGGLAGYATGSVYDSIAPKVFRQGETNARGALALAGAGVGAIPGLTNAAVAAMNNQSPLSNYPWDAVAKDFDVPADLPKLAADAGSMMVPSIPVDAFNKVVWSDVNQNAFGSKSSWGDNSQPMSTPPSAAAAVSGLLAATGAARDSDFVSPWDVAKTVAHLGVNAGIGGLAGLATGAAVGKTLSILAGLSPSTQSLLRSTGTWAGMMTGIAKQVF